MSVISPTHVESLVAIQCEAGRIAVNLAGKCWASRVPWAHFIEAVRLAGFVECRENRLAGVFRGTRTRRASIAA